MKRRLIAWMGIVLVLAACGKDAQTAAAPAAPVPIASHKVCRYEIGGREVGYDKVAFADGLIVTTVTVGDVTAPWTASSHMEMGGCVFSPFWASVKVVCGEGSHKFGSDNCVFR